MSKNKPIIVNIPKIMTYEEIIKRKKEVEELKKKQTEKGKK